MLFKNSILERRRRENTDTGLALVGRNRRGTQALKQNIAEIEICVVNQ